MDSSRGRGFHARQINKSEGVTTELENLPPKEVKLTPQAPQTGVERLAKVAETQVVEELKLFDAWTPQQKRQLWQVVPQWLKAKIRSLINGFKEHTDTLKPQSD
ncbi:hypothetical protein [Gloeocapsopsis dulcis]|uniref:Uncharacterized protein n=1 Tax=Gloeocapsopsis dulcis AAB1 = 1H9 TaxID=1433147 RepID=A0A6N8G2E0_9CHRO|nr:hypothetical protein [Gloeocapsopsis dulcis]MUL39560.1 hypothetical protein [Gloeocapsopsis dulcis AAB1 = 1H9]WNN92246.1 hypothetical protein P0S91_25570 [Gloeocapsopsis dulcis]